MTRLFREQIEIEVHQFELSLPMPLVPIMSIRALYAVPSLSFKSTMAMSLSFEVTFILDHQAADRRCP